MRSELDGRTLIGCAAYLIVIILAVIGALTILKEYVL